MDGTRDSMSEREALRRVAAGDEPADLIVEGGQLVNVFTREVYPADVAIKGSRVAAIGDVAYTKGPSTETLSAAGSYVLPGFIDQHVHVHESQLTIRQFATAVLPRGTTAIATDFYGECVVGGLAASRACVDASTNLPLSVFFELPIAAYVQNIPFGHSGWPTRDEMAEMLSWRECVGADDTFAAMVASGNRLMCDWVDAVQAAGKKLSSHAAQLTSRQIMAWQAYTRTTDDHECTTAAEAVEKARLGSRIVIREGSGCYNLHEVVQALTKSGVDPRRFCFCTDVAPSPVALAHQGHMDHLLRRAVEEGLDPVVAVQMATLNAAECLKVDDDHGSVSPGKYADIAIASDLEQFRIRTVIAKGRLVAEDGRLLEELPPREFPASALKTVKLPHTVTAELFAIRGPEAKSATVRLIGASGMSVATEELRTDLPVRDGCLDADPSRDILKIAAIERVVGTGQIGLGFVQGFGLRAGALATTFNSQQENMIIVGSRDDDMALAANTLAEHGGGFVAVNEGEVLGILELPLFGLDTDRNFDEVVVTLQRLHELVAELGCDWPAPFHSLGFIGLPVAIGNLKIAPEGLIDVWAEKVVPVLVEQPA